MSYLKDELQGFVPTQVASQIVKDVTRGSSVLRLSRVEPMTSYYRRICRTKTNYRRSFLYSNR